MCPTRQFFLQLPCGIPLITSLHFPNSPSIPGFPVAWPCSHMQTLIFTLSVLLPLIPSLCLLLHLSLPLTLSTCSSHALLPATDIDYIQPGCTVDEGSTAEQHKFTGLRASLPAHRCVYNIHYILTTLLTSFIFNRRIWEWCQSSHLKMIGMQLSVVVEKSRWIPALLDQFWKVISILTASSSAFRLMIPVRNSSPPLTWCAFSQI